MSYNGNMYHEVRLIGISDRAKAIIKAYDNKLLLREYNDFGQPMMICPNGKQGIFCVSRDGFWNGWFELDKDVEFMDENLILQHIMNSKDKDDKPKDEDRRNKN